MKSIKPKAFLYSRVSTEKQTFGEGIERQRELGIKFIQEHGYELADSIEDIGKSAYKGHHLTDDAGLGHFLTLCKQEMIPKGSMLVIEQLDRLSRQGHDKSRALLLKLKKHGINLGIVKLNTILEAASDNEVHQEILITVAVDVAKRESEVKSQRINETFNIKRDKVRKGQIWAPEKRPFWLDFNGEEFTQNKFAAVVKYIFQLRIKHKISALQIARKLNSEGVKTAKGKEWTKSGVERVLKNIAVFGAKQFTSHKLQVNEFGEQKRELKNQGEPVQNYYPAVVSEDEYWLAKGVSLRNVRKDGRGIGGRTSTFPNLFRSLSKCIECGSSYNFQKHENKNNTVRLYLKCGDPDCFAPGVRYEKVEKAILPKIAQLRVFKEERPNDSDLKIDSVESELAKVTDSLEANKKKLKTASEHTIDIFAENVEELSIRKTKLTKELESLKSQNVTPENLEDIKLNLSDTNDRYKFNSILKSVCREINFYSRYVLVFTKQDMVMVINTEDDSVFYLALTATTANSWFYFEKEKLKPLRAGMTGFRQTDNYEFQVFDKQKIIQYLRIIEQHNDAQYIFDELEKKKINTKRALRLLKDKGVNYAPLLTKFKGIYLRNAIYKLIEPQSVYFRFNLNLFKDRESYIDHIDRESIKIKKQIDSEVNLLYDANQI